MGMCGLAGISAEAQAHLLTWLNLLLFKLASSTLYIHHTHRAIIIYTSHTPFYHEEKSE